MSAYEYKTVAAPRRAARFRGVAKGADSFARTLEEVLVAEAVDGWEFLRAENLPCEEKGGWLSRRETVFHSILVFRRARPAARAALDRQDPGFAEPAPAFRRTAPEAQAQVQGQGQDPDAALMRLDPGLRDAAAGPRVGPADR